MIVGGSHRCSVPMVCLPDGLGISTWAVRPGILPSRGNRPKHVPVDWPADRLDYESGLKTADLMARHSVSDGAIRQYARREGWTRPDGHHWRPPVRPGQLGGRGAGHPPGRAVSHHRRPGGLQGRRGGLEPVQRPQNANGGYRDFNRVNASSTFTFTHSAIALFISSGSAGNA